MNASRDREDELSGDTLALPTQGEERPLVHVLHITSGRSEGEFAVITGGTLVLGRGRAADVLLEDIGVSRCHAEACMDAAGVWLVDKGSLNGTLVNGRPIQRILLSPSDRIQLGTARLRYSVEEEVEVARLQNLLRLVSRDHLTGVYNRRHFEDRLTAEIAYCARHSAPLALIALDVDRFKSINDTYGHPVGDLALKTVAAALEGVTRAEDVIARVGGEEFMVLARGTGLEGAVSLARRILQRVRELEVPVTKDKLCITVSAGVSAFNGDSVGTAAALVRVADHALFEAKRAGRDRMHVGTWGVESDGARITESDIDGLL